MTAEEALVLNEQVAAALGYTPTRNGQAVAQAYRDNHRIVCCPYNPNIAIPRESFFAPATDLDLAMKLFAERAFVRLEKTAKGYMAVMRLQDDPCYFVMGNGPTVQQAICNALIAAYPVGR